MDVIHYQMEQFTDKNDEYERLWSIVKSIVWVVKHNWKLADKGEFGNLDMRTGTLPFQIALLGSC